MRHLIFLLLAGFLAAQSEAQITGITKDPQGNVVKGATVTLLAAKDSGIVKLAISKEDGTFSFQAVKEGKYLVKASFVEYQPTFSSVFEAKEAALVIPDLKMEKIPSSLKGVVVTAQKPLLEVKADKMIV